MSLFQIDFPNGVRVLNRLLNHAARVRIRKLTRLDREGASQDFDTASLYGIELKLTGARRLYVGDEHVWQWYRGTGVGPYPCISALQALERVCDQFIKSDIPIGKLVAILMEGCENLAVPGLIVGLLLRHLEDAGALLDPYFTEPLVWRLEFTRVVHESGMLTAKSEDLVAPERRNWSLREAAMFMGLSVGEERITEMRVLGETLVSNACRLAGSVHDSESAETKSPTGDTESQLVMHARIWASSLDRDSYEVQETEQGICIQARPPDEVMQTLQENHKDVELTNEATRLFVRYFIDPTKEHAEPISMDELVADMNTALKLLESPSSYLHNPGDISAMIAAAVLEAHFMNGSVLPNETLSVAAEIVLQIGELKASPREFEFEGTLHEYGADRSAARVLPLLLLPCAAQLRAVLDEQDGRTTFERANRACNNLAHAVALEVQLHLARGLDQVWKTPCLESGCCHHEIGWKVVTETMRHCVLGAWNPDNCQRNILVLNEPFAESLDSADDDSVLVSRLDAAIRAFAPAAMANICISSQAGSLLLALLDAQRRSLLIHEDRNLDDRGSHSLVTARALLTLARDSDDAAIYEQLDAFADNSTLLYKLLTALSAAAEETPERAATARRLWPNVIQYVLQLNQSGRTPFQGRSYGDWALGSLIPNATDEVSYLHRDVREKPIIWWSPLELKFEVEEWLVPAAGNEECVDQLISFIRGLESGEQVRVGLPWIVKLVGANPRRIANRTFCLETWLINIRPGAVDANLLPIWQQIVDELVVAGAARLAPYSD